MTVADVRANTEVFNALKAEILAAEQDRIGAFAAFKDIDPNAVIDSITSGAQFSQTFAAQMSVKAMSKQGLQNITDATATTIQTNVPVATDKTEEEVNAFAEALKADVLKNVSMA